ncbi:MAG: transglutaminase domain-containing protein [Candidatus Glassbacteria bacterium]|nr:transglutaminase domain-containing protein [Candidatus Glassbacteria bacterium]
MRGLSCFVTIIPVLLGLACTESREPAVKRLEMDAEALYQGYRAEKVRLDKQAGAVVLDSKKTGDQPAGRLETDVLDPFDPANRLVGPGILPSKVEISCTARVPQGTRVELSASFGNRYFSEEGWSEWLPLEGLSHSFSRPPGRYVRVRLVLSSGDPEVSPQVESLRLTAAYPFADRPEHGSLELALYDNQDIVLSPVTFEYERPDQPVIRDFVLRNGLAGVVAACETELDTLSAVNHWVARVRNTRHGNFANRDYPWDLGLIVSCDEAGKPSIEGHCMSYSIALISALTGLGFHARHWADQGFRFADHEVVEVWSDSFRKWIYLDPSLDHYYTGKDTGEPLSLLELHRVFVDTFFRDGETIRLPMDTQRERVKEIGGRNVPLVYVSGGYAYGKPNPDYDWGWYHGYLAAGFLRLTTRNNFHSRPEPRFPYFGQGVQDFDRFLSWSDEKTPVAEKITRYSDRQRDFYWTLNQAGIKASLGQGNRLELEFGHSQPFFKRFLVSVDSAGLSGSGDGFGWDLHPGENKLTVLPESEWGRRGIPSRLEVVLH